MKRLFHKPLYSVIPILLVILLGITCSIKNPADDLKLIINFDPVKTGITVDFVNAKDATPLDDAAINVTFGGPNGGDVVDLTDAPISTIQVTDAVASFGVTSDFEPTIEQPVQLRIVAQANGYLATSRSVLIDSVGSFSYTVTMVEKDNPPAGVSSEQDNGGATNASGTVTQPIVVSTPTNQQPSGISATVSVPAGTQIRDANNQPLQGQITTTVTYFNAETDQSLNSFPGGFAVNVATNEDGQVDEGQFITAGFVAVEMTDQAGRKAESFGGDSIEIKIEIADGTINPETDAPVEAGEGIDIWSYDDESGEWTYEGRGLVQDDGTGQLFVVYKVAHLSWWNLDYFWNSCRYGIWVDIVGRSQCDPCLYFGLEITQGTTVIRRKVGRICDDIIKFYLSPQGKGGRLKAYMNYWDWYYKRNVKGEVFIDDLCDQVQYPNSTTAHRTSINVTLPSTGFHKIFRFIGVCPGKDDVEVRPSLPLYISENVEPKRYQYLGWVRNGEIELCNLVVPGTYWFRTTYRGDTYEAQVTINADYTLVLDYSLTIRVTQSGNTVTYTVELPRDTCDEL